MHAHGKLIIIYSKTNSFHWEVNSVVCVFAIFFFFTEISVFASPSGQQTQNKQIKRARQPGKAGI